MYIHIRIYSFSIVALFRSRAFPTAPYLGPAGPYPGAPRPRPYWAPPQGLILEPHHATPHNTD